MSDQTPTTPTGPTPPVSPTPAAPVAAPAPPVPAAAPAAAPAPVPPAPAAPVVPPPAAYPAAPGAPGGPGYGSTQGAPPPAGGYFASGKNKTIALIVGGVIAIGAIGGIAALVAGGGEEKTVETSAEAPQGSGVLEPAPVENTEPAPVDPTAPVEPTPTEEPAPTTESPAPAPESDPVSTPAPSGDAVVIGGNIAIPVPAGWEVFGSGDSEMSMGSGSDFVYAVVGTVKPSADAGQVLMNTLESVLPPEAYPDLRTSEVNPQEAFGSVVSLAVLEYEATWTDGQGTVPLHGAIFSAVRQDGTALIILGEHTPPEDFVAAFEANMAPILSAALNGFAGLA